MNKILFILSFFATICAQTLYAQSQDELLSETEMNTDVHTFVFTKEPANPDFSFTGESFLVEGKLIAENNFDTGKDLFFAIQREEFNDILITSLSLNLAGEVEKVMFTYISQEQSNDLDFGVLTSDEKLDISINYDPFLTETIDQYAAEKVEGKIDGILVGKFKTKKELENFKLFLRRN